jgi:hypothetical protein
MNKGAQNAGFLEKWFHAVLVGTALLAMVVQSLIMDEPVLGVLGVCYLLNTVLAGLIYSLVYKLREKHSEKLGFVFLGLSGLKFAAFFVFLYPIFNADGDMSNKEFALFFIPYALTSILETKVLVSALNRVE